MYWLKIRKQRGCDPPIILKYKIPVTTNFRILSYVQRRTRPPRVQRYLHVYFKKVTGRSFAFLLDKESRWAIFRGGRILLHNSLFYCLCLNTQTFCFDYVFYPPPPPKKKKKKKEDAVLLSNWNIKFQVTTTFWILSYVQRRTRPPSVQRYRHILNSCHKQVVHVCWQKKSQSLSHG